MLPVPSTLIRCGSIPQKNSNLIKTKRIQCLKNTLKKIIHWIAIFGVNLPFNLIQNFKFIITLLVLCALEFAKIKLNYSKVNLADKARSKTD